MLQTTGMILDKLGDYSSPRCRLQKLVDKGDYIYLKRGLYEDDPSVPGQALASAIYGPSYLSFDYALHYYDMIPESVFEYTSATCGKNRTKLFRNSFGRYSYRDVPAAAFSEGIVKLDDGYYATWIATPEKALCDKMYSIRPIPSKVPIEDTLFEDLRIDEDLFEDLHRNDISCLSDLYRCSNVRRLARYMGVV